MSTPVDEAADAAHEEAARRLFSAPIDFMLGVTRIADLPDPNVPEVAFAGRSNVGKSSLINAVTGRRQLARTSGTPGRTREINFFNLSDRIRIVDLPGYGYASAPKRTVRTWTNLIHDYLRGRVNLSRVFLLIDARHGLKPADTAIMDTLDAAAVSWQGVLTKADKPKPESFGKVFAETAAELARRPAAHPVLIATSSVSGAGLDALRAEILDLALAEVSPQT